MLLFNHVLPSSASEPLTLDDTRLTQPELTVEAWWPESSSVSLSSATGQGSAGSLFLSCRPRFGQPHRRHASLRIQTS